MKEETLSKTKYWALMGADKGPIPKIKPVQAISARHAFNLLNNQIYKLMKSPPPDSGWQYVIAYAETFYEETDKHPAQFWFQLILQPHDMSPTMSLIGYCLK